MNDNIEKVVEIIVKVKAENADLKAENERLKEEIQMLLNELNERD